MGFYGEYSAFNFPFYTVQDLSMYLRIPYSTLYGWLNGEEKLISPPSEEDEYWNFWDMSSLFVVRYMRERMNVPHYKVRNVSRCLRSRGKKKYSLIQKDVLTGENGATKEVREVLLTHLGGDEKKLNQLVGRCLDRITFGEGGLPESIYPFFLGEDNKSIEIDPRIRFGQPVIAGTSIPVVSVQERILGGEKREDVSSSYRITDSQIDDAMACENIS